MVFTVQTLVISQPIWAMTCAEVYLLAPRNSSYKVGPTTLEVTLSNYYKISEELNESLGAVISETSPQTQRQYPDMFKGTAEIFRHAVQNTIQHSSKELERNDFENAKTSARISITSNDGYVYVEISNLQIKQFPSYLEREFGKHDEIAVPEQQRTGNKGLGFALRFLQLDMAHLPEGSTVKWKSTGRWWSNSGKDEITFTLKIPLLP